MKIILWSILLLCFLAFFLGGMLLFGKQKKINENKIEQTTSLFVPTPTSSLPATPIYKLLENNYHIYQSFNNCGPAALSMTLSYYGIVKSQQELGLALRPYQNPQGDNDDKSVTLAELAEKATEYGFVSYHRPSGTIDIMKKLITSDMPVITRTLLHENEDIGHYRVVKGFDDTTQEFIQDDSLQGKNLRYSYNNFNALWKNFSYEYLVLVRKDKQHIAEEILGKEKDAKFAWEKVIKEATATLTREPNDTTTRFNLSVAYYNVGNFKKSVEEFEKVENQLSFRALWYQIEPIKAYYELGNYEKVFSLTDKILGNYNRAFSELYVIRGNIYKQQDNLSMARSEFEKAVFYNNNLTAAKDALNSL